jgi:hypothetical protein
MTNFDSPTAPGPRARLMYDAVVAAYLNDISDGRRRSAPAANRRRGARRRALARQAVRASASRGRTGVSAERLAITASC